uniref:tRNA-binding domain-containing protein n=1 Tax=Lotharella globosa TaxID=91324 RepID=A0A6V3QG53_9EUKA|mmetsp:Transcript_5178/g.10096  ORF Transcript_5178/g.10096 Transcript_5178/m.10096 type:complete len:276 (+) Transcript_5178:33-860(+)
MEGPIKMVDDLIKTVKAVDIPKAGEPVKASKPKPELTDLCWMPDVPPGHTPFSWLGEEEEEEAPPAAAPQKKKEGKKKQPKEKKAKQKQPQKKKGGKPAASDVPLFARVDLRVGLVERVFEHPNPEVKKLWCEEINVGEDKPRQIASGLRSFYTKDQFQGKKIIVVCNLKTSKLVGFPSHGMVLCASNADHTKVELVEPPANSVPGTRISLANLDVSKFTPDAKINPAKKKNNPWLDWAPKLKTNSSKVVTFDGVALKTPEGDLVVPTLADCIVK